MLPQAEDCDDCVPEYLKPAFGPRAVFSTLPFAATFILLTFFAYRKVYPLLANAAVQRRAKNGKDNTHDTRTQHEPASQGITRQIAALTFSSTIALSVVLTELLLCEISNSLNPSARSLALQITIAGLLGLLVFLIPLLGIYSVVSSSGYTFTGVSRGRLRLAWVLEIAGYSIFLVAFWTVGTLLPQQRGIRETLQGQQSVFQACLDRLGITGVTLMALLSGFASISSIWQNFGPKARRVHETDINRKQAGLDATLDMVAERKERLTQLERKLSVAPAQSFWSRTVGSIRGNADVQEKSMLEMEISGLETMSSSLGSSLSILRARRVSQLQAKTTIGRLTIVFSYSFSCYCVYRILTTMINIFRRLLASTHTPVPGTEGSISTETDPVTYFIALFARHIYPSLDRESWAQQISFLLSGFMLLASFSAVTQTFHLFARFVPSFLHATRTNFALLISQVSGMYVISSALMLRGMMPQEVGSVINGALGAGLLEPRWIQKWFDGWFMTAVTLTALGVFLGRQLGGSNMFDDDAGWDNDIEMGKRTR